MNFNNNNYIDTELDSSDSDSSDQNQQDRKLVIQNKIFYRSFSRRTYVQTCSNDFITGPQLKQFLGIASYHFGDTKDECYISYEKAPDNWRFDPKEEVVEEDPIDSDEEEEKEEETVYEKFSDLPNKRKYFTNVRIGPGPREFYGEIDWTIHGVTVGHTTKWVYHFHLDQDFAHITNGKCYMYNVHGCQVGAHEFGDQLKYQIYIKPCFVSAG